MAAPGTFFDPTNPFKSIVGPTWAGSPPVPPVAGAGQRRMFRPLASSVKMGVGAVLPGGGTGMVISTPPPAFGGVGGGRSGGGGGFHADMGEHFNQKWDPDAHGPGVGGYVPVKIDATPGDGPAPNANPGMGLIQPLPPIFPQPDGAVAPPAPAVGNPANNNAQDAAGRIAANMPKAAYGGEGMHQAIVGDPQADGLPNPEIVTSASPIHVVPMKGGNTRLPHFAYGTPPPAPLPDDLLRGSDGELMLKPNNYTTPGGYNGSKGFDVYANSMPATDPHPVSGVGGDMPPEPSGLGMSVPRTGSAPPPPIIPAPSAEQLLTPPTGKTGGVYDVTGSASRLLGPPVPDLAKMAADPNVNFAAPEFPQGSAVQSAEDFRSDAMSYLRDPSSWVGGKPPAGVPPVQRMGQIIAPWDPKAQQPENRNPIVDKWNAGRNSIREDTAIRRFNRSHPLAGPTMDLQREAKRAEVNREAEKFNIEQLQKEVETARKTAHNIGQERHWDEDIKGRNAVETARLKEQAKKDHEKRVDEATKRSDALGNLQTRLSMIRNDDPRREEKLSILKHIKENQTAEGVENGLKYFDSAFPRAPEETTVGGHKAAVDSKGGFHWTPNPPAQSSKKVEDQRAHYWSD